METADQGGKCCGCGAILLPIDGPVHDYMKSSPACFALFGEFLAAEYSDPALLETHRMTVDTYAVQHPGEKASRRETQSVGLHLARLMLQLQSPLPPKETNDIMLGLGSHKQTLIHLEPPAQFTMTIADIRPFLGTNQHTAKVKEWALSTWNDWQLRHDYIRSWTNNLR